MTPTKYADKLLDHLKTCRTCKAARVRNTDTFCQVGRVLIEKTTKERHG